LWKLLVSIQQVDVNVGPVCITGKKNVEIEGKKMKRAK
jgi:hypothetical protein